MARREFDLSALLDVPLWETVQDQLAEMTGTAIITIDFKGNPITKHSCRTEFCSVIRENPVFRKRCFRCDALAGLEAVRLERPYIYLCHCGIVDVAVPVMVGDRYLGAVMFGQVRLPGNDSDAKVERLVNEISTFQAESENARLDLLEKYERLPEMEYDRIVQAANLIQSMVNYIVDRAVAKQNETQTYHWMRRANADALAAGDGSIQELRQPVEMPRQSQNELPVSKSSAIYPAVNYIATHPGTSVSMNEMANLCHLSPSYFSRLFTREVGEGFTSYVNRQNVEIAKRELRATNKSISQIATELGYLNISHFINLFKRFEGITPLVYRQHKYK